MEFDLRLMLPYILTILTSCVAVWTVWALATVVPEWASRGEENPYERRKGKGSSQ
jgi:hypothetical protein